MGKAFNRTLVSTTSHGFGLALTLVLATAAQAQTAGNDPADPPTAQAGADTTDENIVVTGSRIARAGFDQPTPTTVIGDVELRQGARPNIQQVLNDLPQVRATTTPQASNGNTSSGTAPVDLRGLGTQRTLTLFNGRRFAGENNLNFIPTSLVKRVEVVTGGASAAWGSGAVAGVVNILLDTDFTGLSIGGQSGISSRGDGYRYGVDAAFGTSFAGGRGHFLIGGEYVNDAGILARSTRPQLNSPSFVPQGTGQALVRDVNFGNVTVGGLITSGILAGQTFNPDGTLRPFRRGTPVGAGAFPANMIGGEDGINLYDTIPVSSPFERLSTYARLSYEVGDATFWIDGSYGRALSNAPFFGDYLVGGPLGASPPLTIQANNPYLSQTIRNQLAAAGQTSFTLGRYFTDVLQLRFRGLRVNKEGAIGVDGTFGNGYRYRAWYSHGEVDSVQSMANSRLVRQFNNAINAVSSGGQIVCGINADATTANDDAACRPINPFGAYAASPESLAYVTGTQRAFGTTKLDSAGFEIQGDLFSLWAGPVTVAVGGEARWEEQLASRDAFTLANVTNFGIPVFTSDTQGGFNVKEAFVEVALPLLDSDALKLDTNGAARYSDYSTSGGIWAWKVGGTARLFQDILLRATHSRDIRAPNIGELFAVRSINIGLVNDQNRTPYQNLPGYNPAPSTVQTFTGGNPALSPEISLTTVLGASFSPSFMRGFNLSVDYYDIRIDGAIAALNGAALTAACANGNQPACDRVTRDPTTGTITSVSANQQNLAVLETSGLDIEASYLMNLSSISANLPGTLRLRALATYVDKLVYDTGVTRLDTAGDVGDNVLRSTPKWRGTFTATYQGDVVGFDIRARYIGGGQYDRTRTTLIDNRIGARTYVDLGMQFKVDDRFTLFGNVNNLFDRDPPLTTVSNILYDVVGTYFTAGARVRF